MLLFIASIGVTSQLCSVERRGSSSSHWAPARTRAHPALVLVAHQRMDRDQRDDRVVRRLARGTPDGESGATCWQSGNQTYVMLITVAVTTVTWLIVTFVTAPEPDTKLDAFYQNVRPGGPGWRQVSELAGLRPRVDPRRCIRVDQALARRHRCGLLESVRARQGRLRRSRHGHCDAPVAAVAFAWIANSFRDEDAGVRAQRDVVPATGD